MPKARFRNKPKPLNPDRLPLQHRIKKVMPPTEEEVEELIHRARINEGFIMDTYQANKQVDEDEENNV